MLKRSWSKGGTLGALLCAGLATSSWAQPDVRLCQVFDLKMTFSGTNPTGRVGDTVGLSAATTSWNIGNAQLIWEQDPDWDHPFISTNLYQLKNGRFSQIGQMWVKHGFFALSNTQCGGSCAATNGTRLGIGCTDTYTSNLNATQSGLGPRYEINPWTGIWNDQGSILGTAATNAIQRRLQAKDADIDPALNAGTTYVLEAIYITKDDMNVMNSWAWRPAAVTSGASGANYTFLPNGSSAGTAVNVGMALDAWVGARQTIVAQQIPVVENIPFNPVETWSPDGRAIVASKVTDNGNGTWHYEYAVLNVDMDRQIQSFSIPLALGVVITGAGTSAVLHHEEPFAWSEVLNPTNPNTGQGGMRVNGKPIDNANWTMTETPGVEVVWATPTVTDPAPSNPIRWATMRNFWFDANSGPIDGTTTLGLFKPGIVMSVAGVTDVPLAVIVVPPPHCAGDANGSGTVDFADITAVLSNWGASFTPGSGGAGDANDDGAVDFADITSALSNWNSLCE